VGTNERAMGQRGVARAEDDVGTEFDIELLLRCRGDVDFAEDAESLLGQRGLHSIDRD